MARVLTPREMKAALLRAHEVSHIHVIAGTRRLAEEALSSGRIPIGATVTFDDPSDTSGEDTAYCLGVVEASRSGPRISVTHKAYGIIKAYGIMPEDDA